MISRKQIGRNTTATLCEDHRDQSEGLQYLPRYPGTCFGISESMMVIDQMIPASLGNGMQLMIGKLSSEMTTRGPACAVELIIRIIHLIAAHHGFQTALVEGTVVGHQR